MRRAFLGSAIALSAQLLAVTAQAQALPPPPPPPPGQGPPPPTPVAPTQEPPPPAAKPAAHAAPRTSDTGSADVVSGDLPKPMIAGSAIGVEAYWWSAKRIESGLPFIPYVKIELTPSLVLDLHFPVSFVINARVRGESKAVAGLGNPTVGITYFTTDNRLTWFFGGRLSLPVAGASEEATWVTSNLIGAVSMALYDLHYWAYKYVPFGLRGGLEYVTSPKGNGIVRAEIAPTFMVPINNDDAAFVNARRKSQLYYQMRLEAEYRSQSGWGAGMGLQIVHILSEGQAFGKDDNAQGAIEPFGSYTSSSMFARLGVLIAVDPPFGLGFDSGAKVAALRLNLGSYF